MVDMCTVLTVFIVEPDNSRKEGPVAFLLHIASMDQSVTEAALQSRQGVLQGESLMVQHKCQSSWDPSVTHLLH